MNVYYNYAFYVHVFIASSLYMCSSHSKAPRLNDYTTHILATINDVRVFPRNHHNDRVNTQCRVLVFLVPQVL